MEIKYFMEDNIFFLKFKFIRRINTEYVKMKRSIIYDYVVNNLIIEPPVFKRAYVTDDICWPLEKLMKVMSLFIAVDSIIKFNFYAVTK